MCYWSCYTELCYLLRLLIDYDICSGRLSLDLCLYCDYDMMLLTVIWDSAWCRDGVSILMPVVIRVGPVRSGTAVISGMIWLYPVMLYDFSYWALAHSLLFKLQIRAKVWWANLEHGERGRVHVGQMHRDWVMLMIWLLMYFVIRWQYCTDIISILS